MCRLVESICIKNGVIKNAAYHNARFNRSRQALFGVDSGVDLESVVKMPPQFREGVVKCRVIYEREIIDILFEKYVPKIIRSFRLVTDDVIDYTYKYLDRTAIDRLFSMRGECDDVLIVKSGLITDASSSNVAFFNGSEWYTPASPLLRGTCRARLIDDGVLIEKNIRPSDIVEYECCSPFNAMRDPGEVIVPVSEIFF